MEKVEQVQKRTKEQLCEVLEKKSLNFNVELDDFWKEMKENVRRESKGRQSTSGGISRRCRSRDSPYCSGWRSAKRSLQ